MSAGTAGPPWLKLRGELAQLVTELERAGDGRASAALGRVLQAWWDEQAVWDARLQQDLSLHHEVANALVGVRGNVQLMLMAGAEAPLRERLEVVMRESTRIQDAVIRLRELKARVVPEPAHPRRAA